MVFSQGPSTGMSFCLSICLSSFLYLSFCLSTWKEAIACPNRSNSARHPKKMELDNVKNEAILRDFLNFRSWQRQKTKQFCETSFKNGKLSAELTASYQCDSHFFHSIGLKQRACREKVRPGHTKCCTCHATMILANLKVWCSKMPPLSGNQHPDLLTSLIKMPIVLHLPREKHLCRNPSNVPRLPSFLKMLQNPHVWLKFDKVQNPWCLSHKVALRLQKCPNMVCSSHLLSKCASRHNACTFSTSQASKSGPTEHAVFLPWCLRNVLRTITACTCSTNVQHLNFQKCSVMLRQCCVFGILASQRASRIFAPQRRTLFQKLNFQKCSENGVFCAFWLRGVLRATMECTFPHLSFQECSAPQMFWPFYFQICFAHLRAKVACNSSSHVCQDGSAPAALANLLFDPPELQIIGKTQCFATFLPFHAPSFFFDLLSSSFLFSDSFPHLLFHLSILSEAWLLNLLRQ